MASDIKHIDEMVTHKKINQKEEVKPEEKLKHFETAPDQRSMFGEVTSAG